MRSAQIQFLEIRASFLPASPSLPPKTAPNPLSSRRLQSSPSFLKLNFCSSPPPLCACEAEQQPQFVAINPVLLFLLPPRCGRRRYNKEVTASSRSRRRRPSIGGPCCIVWYIVAPDRGKKVPSLKIYQEEATEEEGRRRGSFLSPLAEAAKRGIGDETLE